MERIYRCTFLKADHQRLPDLGLLRRYARRPLEVHVGPKRKPLTGEQIVERHRWSKRLRQEDLPAGWFNDNVVWIDMCNKIIPGGPQKAADQGRSAASKRKHLMNPRSRNRSQNLAGGDVAEKQASRGDTKVWFFVALAKGKLGVHVFHKLDFPGETQEGAGMCIEVLRKMLDKMLGATARKPKVLFSDRAQGCYHKSYGSVTSIYDGARCKHRFKFWAGMNCLEGWRKQPADIGDVLLHETAIQWLRARFAKTIPRERLSRPNNSPSVLLSASTLSMRAIRLRICACNSLSACGVWLTTLNVTA